MKIKALTDEKCAAWDDFVLAQPSSSFFHLSGWKTVIEKAFGFETHYMFAEDGGEICGLLPLACVKRPIFGTALISTPLCVYGGAVGQATELEEVAAKKARDLNVGYLELRSQVRTEPDWPVSKNFFTFKRNLSNSHDQNLKDIPRKQRAEIRKGMKASLQTSNDRNIDLFYKIYSASLRNLGSPVYPKKYLKILLETFGDQCEFTSVAFEGKALASVLSFYFKDEVLPYYGGGLPEARHYSAYPYMYWEVMKRATDKNVQVFDFGRSMRDTGAFAFKKNFGFEAQALSYQYNLVKATSMPDMNPNNKRNEQLSNLWKRLPMPLANTLGPIVYPVVV